MSTLHVTSTFRQLLFQSKQKKAELLRTYDFGNMSLWEITESKEEEEAKDQKFIY
ncbi:hypothetical protein G9A89_009396 [Geosiphon pyriformis]|nr:hypothetical protein G9A89_009396 [Geosiphon pyriformis]